MREWLRVVATDKNTYQVSDGSLLPLATADSRPQLKFFNIEDVSDDEALSV